jgi:hypothetical protein
VVTEYRGVSGVAFDLFNEPPDISWSCWLNGCTTPGGWPAVGMQQLINAVRATGATQPVIAEGLAWGGELSGWLATEVGENDCAAGFLGTLLPWADAHGIGYLAWAWDTASCGGGPSLITAYDGTPTAYGAAYKQYLASRPSAGAAARTPVARRSAKARARARRRASRRGRRRSGGAAHGRGRPQRTRRRARRGRP